MSPFAEVLRLRSALARGEQLVDALVTQSEKVNRDITGTLQVIATLCVRAGGEIRLPASELADIGGAVKTFVDPETDEYVFIYVPPQETNDEQPAAPQADGA